VDECRNTRGCIGVNFQDISCPHKAEEQKGQGACYVMNEDCVEGPNDCWSVIKLPEDERHPPSFGDKVTRQAGCKNIGTIGQGQVKMFSVFECQVKCEIDPKCTGFLELSKGCHAASQFLHATEIDFDDGHTCELLYGVCEEDAGDTYACWDVHYKTTKQGTVLDDMYHFTEASKAGATTIHVTDEECFRIGDEIQVIYDQNFDSADRYNITSLNPMTLSKPTAHDYDESTGVMRRNHPCSPKYCGDWPEDMELCHPLD
jgi:hypothetical protein